MGLLSKILYLQQKKNRTEAKAKVVAAGWGTELFLLNAAQDIQRLDDLKKGLKEEKMLGGMVDLGKWMNDFV